MTIYAGIGSRETPARVLHRMQRMGLYYALKGYTLRSGHARGADRAFEHGCDQAMGPKEIFYKEDATYEAFQLAPLFHPTWNDVGDAGQALMARNCMIILGKNLDTPVDFVECWTLGGEMLGGTAHALRLALSRGIPIKNYGTPVPSEVVKERLEFYSI